MTVKGEIMKLGGAVIAFVVVAVTSVLGIILLSEFKETDGINLTTTANTTIDVFIAAIAIFGSFGALIALMIVGKILLDLVGQFRAN